MFCALEPSSPQTCILPWRPVSKRKCLIALPLIFPLSSRRLLAPSLGNAITAVDPWSAPSSGKPTRKVEPDHPAYPVMKISLVVGRSAVCGDQARPPSGVRWKVRSWHWRIHRQHHDILWIERIDGDDITFRRLDGPRLAPAHSAACRGVEGLRLLARKDGGVPA